MLSLTPTLLTSASRRPNSRRVWSTAAAQFSGCATSAEIMAQEAPELRSSACKWFAASASLSMKTGIAASRPQPRVIAAPMPLAPPVIRTTLPLSCKSMLRCFQTVEANGVAAEDSCFVGFGKSFHVVLDDPLHLGIGCGEEADRPIGAEHQALGTEGFEDDVEVGLEVFWLPVMPIRFGDQA